MYRNTIHNLPSTPLFPSNTTPSYPGLYQVLSPTDDPSFQWCYFDGKRWGNPHPNKAVALTRRYRVHLPYGRKVFEWRGSPKKAKSSKKKPFSKNRPEVENFTGIPKGYNIFFFSPPKSGIYKVESHGVKGFAYWNSRSKLWGRLSFDKNQVDRSTSSKFIQNKNWKS